jgi:hypothetical protein
MWVDMGTLPWQKPAGQPYFTPPAFPNALLATRLLMLNPLYYPPLHPVPPSPQTGALELIRVSPMSLTSGPSDKAARISSSSSLGRQLADKLSAKMAALIGGPFPYAFR